MIGDLALRVDLAYVTRHKKAPPCDGLTLIPVCHNGWPFFFFSTLYVSKWYWGTPRAPQGDGSPLDPCLTAWFFRNTYVSRTRRLALASQTSFSSSPPRPKKEYKSVLPLWRARAKAATRPFFIWGGGWLPTRATFARA